MAQYGRVFGSDPKLRPYYFREVLDTIDPHQYISLGVLLAVRVGDVLTLREKDTNTIRELLIKLLTDWQSQQVKGSNPRQILAQKLHTLGLHSQADKLLQSATKKGTIVLIM